MTQTIQQRFLFGKRFRPLSDGDELMSCGIVRDSTVHLVVEGGIRGGGCKHSKETSAGGGSGGGGGAAVDSEKSKSDKKLKELLKPPSDSFNPEVFADIERRLAKAKATEATAEQGDGSSIIWPSWRTDTVMVELPDGTKFDVNSTIGVLAMLVADGLVLGNEICRAILVILDQKDELDEQRWYVEQHRGAVPPEVIAVATSSAFDAFGVVSLKCVDLEQQLKELDAKPTSLEDLKDELRVPLDAQLKEQREQLVAAYASIASWGLEIDQAVLQTPLAVFESLPIAARQGEITMQTVVGQSGILDLTSCFKHVMLFPPSFTFQCDR
jgi:hypothetical protein